MCSSSTTTSLSLTSFFKFRVYGKFRVGPVADIIDSHTLTLDEAADPLIRRDLARSFARLHSLRMPFRRRNPEDQFVRDLIKNKKRIATEKGKALVASMDIDWAKELEWLMGLFVGRSCRRALCLGDVVVMDIDLQDEDEPVRTILIDSQTVNYGYRGIDIGQHFSEQGDCWDHPTNRGTRSLEAKRKKRLFCELYLQEMQALGQKLTELDTVDHLLLEAEIGQMYHLLWSVLMCGEIPEEDALIVGLKQVLDLYHQLKQVFTGTKPSASSSFSGGELSTLLSELSSPSFPVGWSASCVAACQPRHSTLLSTSGGALMASPDLSEIQMNHSPAVDLKNETFEVPDSFVVQKDARESNIRDQQFRILQQELHQLATAQKKMQSANEKQIAEAVRLQIGSVLKTTEQQDKVVQREEPFEGTTSLSTLTQERIAAIIKEKELEIKLEALKRDNMRMSSFSETAKKLRAYVEKCQADTHSVISGFLKKLEQQMEEIRVPDGKNEMAGLRSQVNGLKITIAELRAEKEAAVAEAIESEIRLRSLISQYENKIARLEGELQEANSSQRTKMPVVSQPVACETIPSQPVFCQPGPSSAPALVSPAPLQHPDLSTGFKCKDCGSQQASPYNLKRHRGELPGKPKIYCTELKETQYLIRRIRRRDNSKGNPPALLALFCFSLPFHFAYSFLCSLLSWLTSQQ